jgi:hypothetical protein
MGRESGRRGGVLGCAEERRASDGARRIVSALIDSLAGTVVSTVRPAPVASGSSFTFDMHCAEQSTPDGTSPGPPGSAVSTARVRKYVVRRSVRDVASVAVTVTL